MASLIGNKPNQVPTNGDLGSMAYQDASLYQTRSELQGMRNRIINGDMRIDQRNAGASVTPASGDFTLDRWKVENATDATIAIQQSSTAPAGFSNSLSVTISTGDASIGATQYATIRQTIEGYNIADFGFGTANAKTVTLSFWVRSSVTGTLSGTLRGASNGQFYPYTYTVSSANTWEYKTVTISGATSGTWGSTNDEGLRVYFTFASGSTYQAAAGSWTTTVCLGATGATNIAETTGATFYITGVQLEVGSVATLFERRQYGQELALCQRYFEKAAGTIRGSAFNQAGVAWAYWFFKETKRASPTVSYVGAYYTGVETVNPDYVGVSANDTNYPTLGTNSTAEAEL